MCFPERCGGKSSTTGLSPLCPHLREETARASRAALPLFALPTDNRKASMAQERVLIIEDEENERTGLAELVKAWGYRTETAGDGLEGLEKITSFAPAIVVTDMKMPGLDGMGVLQRVAAQPAEIAVNP